ncbi:MAG: hypothetical protein ACRD2L_05855 [Terriglobia bacterium]
MKSGRRASHTDHVVSSLRDPKEIERFTAARQKLKQHLVHTREILNGKDFLFSGPVDELHGALKDLVEIEHRCSRFLQFDYAQIEEYFLLRIGGLPEHSHIIESYFE